MLVFQGYGWKQPVQEEAKKRAPSPRPYKTEQKEILGYNPVAIGEWKVAYWMGPDYNLVGITTKSNLSGYFNAQFYYRPDGELGPESAPESRTRNGPSASPRTRSSLTSKRGIRSCWGLTRWR